MSALVDWALAERLAALAAGEEPDAAPDAGLAEVAADALVAVRGYTRLQPAAPIPEAEWVSRREWARVNLGSLRSALEAVEGELGGWELPGAAGAPLRLVAGAQLGALVGYASRRVLGQYEFPVLGPARPSRLLFVRANVAEAGRSFGGEPRAVLRWIALHEVTHAVHFAAAPWLREHLRGLAAELLAGSKPKLGTAEIGTAARKLTSTDPRRVLAELRASDPLTLLTPPSSRPLLDAVQATMASIEGYAEHAMDAAAPRLGEDVTGLRAGLERRRDARAPLARLLGWLVGMELKLRQYRDGKRFCDEVVATGGIAALNAAWRDAAALPSAAEIADPAAWIARTAPLAA